jgi:hypothetical protein
MIVDQLIRTAIDERRLVAFALDGRARIVEPHDYGVKDGEARLFCYQVGGESNSGHPRGWRWAFVSKIRDLRLLDGKFPGTRPVPTGRHIQWDQIIASVSRRP